MILFFTLESPLWKKNRQSLHVTLLGTTFWSLIAVIIAFAISFALPHNGFTNYSWLAFGLVSAQAVLVVFNILLWVAIMRCMPLSIAEPVALFRVILLTVLAFLIFGGALSVTKILLVVAIFLAVVGISLLQTIGKKRQIDKNYLKGFLLLFIWVLTSVGINLINQYVVGPVRFGNLGVPPITHATIQTILVFAVALIYFLIKRPREIKPAFGIILKNKIHMGIGASGVFGRVCFTIVLAFTGMNVGVLTAIQMATVALVVIYSVIFLKERPKLLSYFLIAVTIGCAVALSLPGI
jgi:drug/metabolite transporter (DMT)-like permease